MNKHEVASQSMDIPNTKWDSLTDINTVNFGETGCLSEKNIKKGIKDVAEILKNKDLLHSTFDAYLNQYDPKAQISARDLHNKCLIDSMIVHKLNENPNFTETNSFKNYANELSRIVNSKSLKVGNEEYYPEVLANPIFQNRRMTELFCKATEPNRPAQMLEVIRNERKRIYECLDKINQRLDKGTGVSNEEVVFLADYIYSSKNYNDGKAKKLTCFILNDIDTNPDIKTSIPLLGALANYCKENFDTTDSEETKNASEIVRKNTSIYLSNLNLSRKEFFYGYSRGDIINLESEHFIDTNLRSDKSLEKPRTNEKNDIYRFMLIIFHELTHGLQRELVNEGSISSSAMSLIMRNIFSSKSADTYRVTRPDDVEVKCNYYKANHDADEIEIEADEQGWKQCRKFICEHERNYIYAMTQKRADEWSQKKTQRSLNRWAKCSDNAAVVAARRTFSCKKTPDGEKILSQEYDISTLGRYIKDDSNILKTYPALAEFYQANGKLRPDLLINKKIAIEDYDVANFSYDSFGSEVGTHIINDNTEFQNLLDFIDSKDLTNNEINKLTGNLHRIVRTNVSKIRAVEDLNFDLFDETRTHQEMTVSEMKTYYLKQFLSQTLKTNFVAYKLYKKNHENEVYLKNLVQEPIRYFNEISRSTELDKDFARSIVKKYKKSPINSLHYIADEITKKYL